MYNPTRFKNSNVDEAVEFISKNPFAILISTNHDEVLISHLPIVLKEKNDSEKLILTGHMARANEHWKYLSGQNVKIIFNGVHSYISALWYAKNDVPTWNYVSAHVTGRLNLIEDFKGISQSLIELNKHMDDTWNFFIPEDLKGDNLSLNIVAFEIEVLDINFKQKLSQNKSISDRLSIINNLALKDDSLSQNMAHEMKQFYKI